jgi:hypothetical protein
LGHARPSEDSFGRSHRRAEKPARAITSSYSYGTVYAEKGQEAWNCTVGIHLYTRRHRRLPLLLLLAAVMTTPSQNKLVLLCLIEGNRQPSYISVPYYSNGALVTVDDLKKEIFECSCKPEGLANTRNNLTLIKVGILLVVVVTSLLLDLF